MTYIGFKVWLADASVVKADSFADLPAIGIVILMAYYDQCFDVANRHHYRKVLDGCDWYYFDQGDIQGVRSSNTKDEWNPAPEGISAALMKKSAPELSNAAFNKISDTAMQDYIY